MLRKLATLSEFKYAIPFDAGELQHDGVAVMELGNVWARLDARLGELAAEATKATNTFLTVEEVRLLSQAEGAPFEENLGEVAQRLDAVLGETVEWLKKLNAAMKEAKDSSQGP